MRNVVPGSTTFRFARPLILPLVVAPQQLANAAVPVAAAGAAGEQNSSDALSTFKKWTKQSSKSRQWKSRGRQPQGGSLLTSAASAVLPSLFSYFSWIPRIIQLGSDMSSEMATALVRPGRFLCFPFFAVSVEARQAPLLAFAASFGFPPSLQIFHPSLLSFLLCFDGKSVALSETHNVVFTGFFGAS